MFRDLTKSCGCLYEENNTTPWYVCPKHYSGKFAVRTSGIEWQTKDFVISNPLTANADLGHEVVAAEGQEARHFWLYALLLEDDKYYVGITSKGNPYSRIKSHGDIWGARWTEIYKPRVVMEIRDLGVTSKRHAEATEQNLTMAYIKLYGHKNVRGGSLTYTGRYYQLGNRFWRDKEVDSLLVASLLIALSLLYISS